MTNSEQTKECECHCHRDCPGAYGGKKIGKDKSVSCLCYPRDCEHCKPRQDKSNLGKSEQEEGWEKRLLKEASEGKLPFVDYSQPVGKRTVDKFKLIEYIRFLLHSQQQKFEDEEKERFKDAINHAKHLDKMHGYSERTKEREILEIVIDHLKGQNGWDATYHRLHNLLDQKQKFEKDLVSIIGEDEPDVAIQDMRLSIRESKNWLRSQQRQRAIKKGYKVEF